MYLVLPKSDHPFQNLGRGRAEEKAEDQERKEYESRRTAFLDGLTGDDSQQTSFGNLLAAVSPGDDGLPLLTTVYDQLARLSFLTTATVGGLLNFRGTFPGAKTASTHSGLRLLSMQALTHHSHVLLFVPRIFFQMANPYGRQIPLVISQ